MVVALVGALFVAFAIAAGLLLGASYANALWIERASLKGGLRKENNGSLYWVVDASDHVACNTLREWLEIEQDKREGAEALQRLHGFKKDIT